MISERASIYPAATIHESANIGDFCCIGLPAENRATFPALPFGVRIGANSSLTKLVTVDAGTVQETVIGENCMLMAHSHVGHDAIIGDNVTIACGAKIGGFVEIGDWCNIGLNATIHQRVKVPQGCMIGMGCVVTKATDLKPFGVYVGNPARFLRFNDKVIKNIGLTDIELGRIIGEFELQKSVKG